MNTHKIRHSQLLEMKDSIEENKYNKQRSKKSIDSSYKEKEIERMIDKLRFDISRMNNYNK